MTSLKATSLNNNSYNNFYDFNTAQSTSNSSYGLIPRGTIAKVKLKIKPGGYSDESKGLTGGYASLGHYSGSIYLKCEYTIIAGKYKRRKIWSMIGLFSPKNDNAWGNMGRSFIRSILNSSHGFTDSDKSPEAIKARKVESFADLDGLEFVVRIDVKHDTKGGTDGNDKNDISRVITPEHKDYSKIMDGISYSINHDTKRAAVPDDQIPWLS